MDTSYSDILKSPKWKLKRKEILRRDNYKCVHCHSSSNLHVHHRQYHFCANTNAFVVPWKYDNKKLITLCANCHEDGHKKYNVPVIKI